ncbi:hypothetical protein IAU60_004671 [Kwoniella sp. DSM 27419]
MHPLSNPSSFLLTLSALLSGLSSTSAHRNTPRRPQAHGRPGPAPVPRGHQLDERLMPITATTTVVVQMTATHTVWVQPTGQVVFPLPGGVGGAGDSSDSAAGSSTVTPSASISDAASTWDSTTKDQSSSTIASESSSESASRGDSYSSSTYISDSSYLSSTIASSTITSSDYPSSAFSTSVSASEVYSDAENSTSAPSSEASVTSAPVSESASTRLSSSSHSHGASSSATASEGSSSVSSSISPSETATDSVAASSTVTDQQTASASETGSASITTSNLDNMTATSTDWWQTSSETATSDATAWETSAETESSTMEPTATATATSTSTLISVTASVTSASATASASAGTGSLEPIGGTVMCAYYPDWSGWYLPPESVDWSRFDVVDFAFALPTADYGLEFTQDDSADLLRRLVSVGHAAGKRVKLSIGGWTGSSHFSPMCKSESNRRTFINNVLAAYHLYNLDGIDIDWEYPGTTGADGNAVSSQDSANFLLLLQELRAALPDGALITLATQVWPFAASDGSPMSDVSGFAKVIDWILIMNYDVWGSSSTPGANAPLSDGCGNSTQPLANAYAAVSSWTGAGMPANQITLGVPAYGYLQKSTASQLIQRRSSFPVPPHKLLTNGTSHQTRQSYVTVYNDNGGSADGQVMFESLISQGALKWDGDNNGYVGSSGFERHWDGCSSTPWLKSEQSGQIITYDDPQSMNLKGQFAAQVGLKGCNIFSIDGDWTGSSWPLTDAVRSGLGL